jgi:hypothetical protein
MSLTTKPGDRIRDMVGCMGSVTLGVSHAAVLPAMRQDLAFRARKAARGDVGMTGLLGFSSGYHAMMDCDALLMLGTDFPYQQFYPKDAKIVQVDLRGEQIGRRTRVDLGLVRHVRETLRALMPILEDKGDHAYLDRCLEHLLNPLEFSGLASRIPRICDRLSRPPSRTQDRAWWT